MAIRWAAYLRLKDNPAAWDCEFCKEKGLSKQRNCDGNLNGFCSDHGTIKYEDAEISETSGKPLCPKCRMGLKMPFEIVLGKKYRLFQCPLNAIDPEALYLIRLVSWSENIGITPSGCSLFDETSWYNDLREFVIYEQAQVREEFEPTPGPTTVPKQGSPSSGKRR
jgi:hypothetical protein